MIDNSKHLCLFIRLRIHGIIHYFALQCSSFGKFGFYT